MVSPKTSLKKFLFRIGKQVEPIIRLPDDCSVVDIRTNTIRDENIVWDTYKNQGWEIKSGAKVHAIYIDGIFKGHGHFVADEGIAVDLKMETIPGAVTIGPAPGPGGSPGGPQRSIGPGSSHTITPASMDKNGSMMGKNIDLVKNVVLKSSKADRIITARYEGHIGTLAGVNMIQRGSVLQPSRWETLVWCGVSLLLGAFVLGPMIMR